MNPEGSPYLQPQQYIDIDILQLYKPGITPSASNRTTSLTHSSLLNVNQLQPSRKPGERPISSRNSTYKPEGFGPFPFEQIPDKIKEE